MPINKYLRLSALLLCLLLAVPGALLAADEDYLVISHNALNGTGLANLVTNIESRGYSVAVHLISDGATADDVKSYIEQKYYGSKGIPRFVLLVGATRYLEGNGFTASAADNNFVPAYYAEDHYSHVTMYDMDYVNFDPLPLLDGREPASFPNMFIGRLPAISNEDIQNYVDKLLLYYAYTSPDEWKDNVLMLVGDKDRGVGTPPREIIITQMDDIAANHLPSTMEVGEIKFTDYTDAMVMQQAVIDSINAGHLFVYCMATGANPLSMAYIIGRGEGDGFDAYTDLSTTGRMPIIFGASCSLGQSDDAPDGTRFWPENFLFAPYRGAIAFIGPAGATSQYANYMYSQYVFDIFASHPFWTMGQIFSAAKIAARRDEADAGLMDTHEMYTYFGDPSLVIYNDSISFDETTTHFDFEYDTELPKQNTGYDVSNHVTGDTCGTARCAGGTGMMTGAYCLKVSGTDIEEAPGPVLAQWEIFDVSIPINSATRFFSFYEKAVSHPNNVAGISLNCLLESGGMLSDTIPGGPAVDQYGNALSAACRTDPLSPDKAQFYAFDISGHNGDRIVKILAEYDAADNFDTGHFEAYFDEIRLSDTWGNEPVVGDINIASSVYKGNTATASISAEDLSDQLNKGDQLVYSWSTAHGYFTGDGYQVTYHAPSYVQYDVLITCEVSDLGGHTVTRTAYIDVKEPSSGGCPFVYVRTEEGYIKGLGTPEETALIRIESCGEVHVFRRLVYPSEIILIEESDL